MVKRFVEKHRHTHKGRKRGEATVCMCVCVCVWPHKPCVPCHDVSFRFDPIRCFGVVEGGEGGSESVRHKYEKRMSSTSSEDPCVGVWVGEGVCRKKEGEGRVQWALVQGKERGRKVEKKKGREGVGSSLRKELRRRGVKRVGRK